MTDTFAQTGKIVQTDRTKTHQIRSGEAQSSFAFGDFEKDSGQFVDLGQRNLRAARQLDVEAARCVVSRLQVHVVLLRQLTHQLCSDTLSATVLTCVSTALLPF